MTIDISPEIEVRLKAKAVTEGVSVGEYVGRLVLEEDARRIRLNEFTQAIDERLRSLDGGESVDGEEVMARLIGELDEGELDEHQHGPSAR
jgi:predicted transcriptional regulator